MKLARLVTCAIAVFYTGSLGFATTAVNPLIASQTVVMGPGPEAPAAAKKSPGVMLAAKAQVVPQKPQPAYWSKEAKLLSYRCKNLKLEVRSRISPSTTYDLSDGLFKESECKEAISSLEKKGCFCDGGDLKCIETEKIEPRGFACAGILFCFAWEGESIAILRVKNLGNHITPSACKKELKDLDREV